MNENDIVYRLRNLEIVPYETPKGLEDLLEEAANEIHNLRIECDRVQDILREQGIE